MLYAMDTRGELIRVLWAAIGEMERARLKGDTDHAWRLERIVWRMVGVIEGMPGRSDCQIRKH